MSKIVPFSITSQELSRSLTVAPSQRPGCILVTIHSTAQPAATIGLTLGHHDIERLVKRLSAMLPVLQGNSKPEAVKPRPPG